MSLLFHKHNDGYGTFEDLEFPLPTFIATFDMVVHYLQDIVWHGLKLYCTAKMIQRTAISSPHSGTGQLFIGNL